MLSGFHVDIEVHPNARGATECLAWSCLHAPLAALRSAGARGARTPIGLFIEFIQSELPRRSRLEPNSHALRHPSQVQGPREEIPDPGIYLNQRPETFA